MKNDSNRNASCQSYRNFTTPRIPFLYDPCNVEITTPQYHNCISSSILSSRCAREISRKILRLRPIEQARSSTGRKVTHVGKKMELRSRKMHTGKSNDVIFLSPKQFSLMTRAESIRARRGEYERRSGQQPPRAGIVWN